MLFHRSFTVKIIIGLLGLYALIVASITSAATIVVNTDTTTPTSGDGLCTIIEAIDNANNDSDSTGGDCVAGSGADTINFNIAGGSTSTQTIDNVSFGINSPIILDGLSQGDATCGVVADFSDRDIDIAFTNSNISINSGSDGTLIQGISILNTGTVLSVNSANDVIIRCSNWGIDPTGTTGEVTRDTQISIAQSSNITLGDLDPGEGNMVAGGNNPFFAEGIRIDDSHDLFIYGNRIGIGSGPAPATFPGSQENVEICGPTSCGGGIPASTNIVFDGNTIADSTGGGVTANGVIGLVVNNNVFSNNGGDGFFVSEAMTLTFDNNNFLSNGVEGLGVSDSQGVTLTNNTADLNTNTGVLISGSQDITLDTNTSTNNGNHGVDISNSNNLILASNVANMNTNSGVVLNTINSISSTSDTTNSNGNNGFDNITITTMTVTGLTATLNNSLGFGVSDSTGIDLAQSTLADNMTSGVAYANVQTGTIMGNIITGNGEDGISIDTAAQDITIGSPSSSNRNIISGNEESGITISTSDLITVQGNYIGTDATGLVANSNGTTTAPTGGETGIFLEGSSSITIGGPNANEGNVISGNNDPDVAGAIFIVPDFGGTFAPSSDIIIQGNYIGMGSDGTTSLPNAGAGVVHLGAENVLIKNNIIQGHTVGGVGLFSAPLPTGLENISIIGNSIYNNNETSIDFFADTDGNFAPDALIGPNTNDISDIDEGPNAGVDPRNNLNHLLNYPVIYDATDNLDGTTTVDFYLDVPALAPTAGGNNYRIEFFQNSVFPAATLHGEGETFLDAVEITHTGAGVETFSHTLNISSGAIISSTATEIEDNTPAITDLAKFGSTSEFGNTIVVESIGADYGDAPSALGYATDATDNGPYHITSDSVTTYLGSCVDANPYTLGSTPATGDDLDQSDPTAGTCDVAGDDEDGVAITAPFTWGAASNVDVTASAPGELYVWIDFDQNGSFEDAGELVRDGSLDANDLAAGSNTISITVPAGAGTTVTYARFRYNSPDINGAQGAFTLSSLGESLDGEVEDYQVTIIDPGTTTIDGTVTDTTNATTFDGITVEIYMDNGVVGTYEPGIDTLIASQVTSGGGNYSMTGLPAASYLVQTIAPTNYQYDTSVNPQPASITADGVSTYTTPLDLERVPLVAPTIVSQTTTDTTPVITGTWDQGAATTLAVTIDGTTYTLGVDVELTSDGSGNWTLDLSGAAPLTSGVAYDLVVTTTDGGVLSVSDSTTDEVSITTYVDPTVNTLSTNNLNPTITGTWDQTNGDPTSLMVTIDGTTYTLGTDPELTSIAGVWSLDLSTATSLVLGTTYDVAVSASDISGSQAVSDTTTNEVRIEDSGPTRGGYEDACKDPEALNYDDSQFKRHDPDLCDFPTPSVCFPAIDPDCPEEELSERTTVDDTTPLSSTSSSSTTTVFNPDTQCPYFTEYLKKGDTGAEVMKVQHFLNAYMDTNLTVDGTYGPATRNAVKDFQEQHRSDILDPWNLVNPTGRWYKTTRGNANEIIGCEAPDVYLEDVNITNSFDNTNIFNTFVGKLFGRN
jgi:parallel beta-helix repeat protein